LARNRLGRSSDGTATVPEVRWRFRTAARRREKLLQLKPNGCWRMPITGKGDRVARRPGSDLECAVMSQWFPRLAMVYVAALMVKMVYALATGRDYVFGRWDSSPFTEGKVLRGNALLATLTAMMLFVGTVLASLLHWLPKTFDRPLVYTAMVVALVLSTVLPRRPESERNEPWI
jgi:hypothetical protein